MISVELPSREMIAALAKLEKLRSAARRNILMTVGRKSAGIMLPAMKAEPKPKVLGILQKSFKKKVKAYATNNTVFVAVGSRSKFTEVKKYKDYRTGKIRRWIAGQPAKGPKKVNPAFYGHLAGPGRKGMHVRNVTRRMQKQVDAMIRATLLEELAKK